MNTESDTRKDKKQRREKKKGLRMEENRWQLSMDVTDVTSSQADGGGRDFFYSLKTTGKWADQKGTSNIWQRNDFTKHFAHLSPYCRTETHFNQNGFYMLFLEPDQSVASLVNIFLKVPKCAWNMPFCYNPNGLQSLQAVVSSTRINNVVPMFGWWKPPETYQELKRETL